MSDQPKMQPKMPLGLELAGKARISIRGADGVEKICRCLQVASAVLLRRGDRTADIRAFKVACSMNYRALMVEAEKLGLKARTMLSEHAKQTDWQEASRLLAEEIQKAKLVLSPDGAMALIDPESRQQTLMLLGDDEDAKRDAEAVIAKVEMMRSVLEVFERGVRSRLEAMREAARMLDGEIEVDVWRISWHRAPNGLSGGYLRALAWMWETCPDTPEAIVVAQADEGIVKVLSVLP